MKIVPISILRSPAFLLALASAMVFSIAGIAHAQYGDSGSAGQSSTGQDVTGQREAPRPSEKDKYGIPQEPMDTGYVDQKKRVERASDPASPSKDTHVPEFSRDKEGRPIKDPMYEQGGPIGPN